MVEDFSTQFNPLYLRALSDELRDPVYTLVLYRYVYEVKY